MNKPKLQVNQVSYPDRKLFEKYLDVLYGGQNHKENGWLQLELERKLSEHLGSKHVFFTANGTMALLISLLALDKKGTVILSAFGHPATVNAVIAAGCTPKFCDIEPTRLSLNPELLSEIIDVETVAVMPTHIYGNACDHSTIDSVTKNAGVTLIYDSSHAFGSKWMGRPLVTYGDVTALSLQAFKVFSSMEGGLILTDDDHLAEMVYRHRFFGKDRSNNFVGFGINGKGSDLHAALALANLESLDRVIEKRRSNVMKYRAELRKNNLFELYQYHKDLVPNYAYLPIIFKKAKMRETVIDKLSNAGIYARRYFHPSLNKLPFVEQTACCPISESVAERVMCVPIHQTVTNGDIELISDMLNGFS